MDQRICNVPECVKPAKRGSRMCSMHTARLARHGDVNTVLYTKQQRLQTNGYWTASRPDHPLAMKDGRVYVHRVTLYDSVNGTDQRCRWCGTQLHWFGSPKLTVDHLDWNRGNNDLANLVACCVACNTGRLKHHRRGEELHNAVLSDNDVLEIRASVLIDRDLAAIYGVTTHHIGRVRRGERWKHLLASPDCGHVPGTRP